MVLTAAEARELSGPTADEHLAALEQHIRRAAEARKREVLIRDEPFGSWLYGGRDQLADAPRAAIVELERLGYTVDFFYEERQFVDMALRVRW